jgi:predicted acylesterase/phospholipase RssA
LREIARLALGLVALVILAAVGGCATPAARNAVPLALVEQAEVRGLKATRFWGDETGTGKLADVSARLPNMKAVAIAEKRENGRPVVNFLALSGGGADGAFGAGLLVGWSEAGTRPKFQVVTGVSTGAIIATFAFLGPRYDDSLREVFTQYATGQLLETQLLSGIFGGAALADSAPLAGLIAKYVDQAMLDEVAREYRSGRMLLIGTTNLDAQRPVIWNMGEIAASGHPDAINLFRKVILASASIPGVFPPVTIDVAADGQVFEEMHVDGGPTRQVFLTPAQLSLRDFDVFYDKPPVRHIYIIRNAKLSPDYEPAQANALAITAKTITTLIMNQSQGDLLRIYTTAKRGGADFNLAAIPTEFQMAQKEPFDRAYMQELFKKGMELARDGYKWLKQPPELGHSIALN